MTASTASTFSNITRLIDKRAIINNEISNAIQKLSTLSHNLSAIENSNRHISYTGKAEVNKKISSEDIAVIIQEIEEERERLFKLKERFSKKDICIGVLGRARQGKSTILQSLSGLDASIIPDGNGLHCTAVTSLISNSESRNVDVTVKFRTRDDFFQNTVLPYFNDLHLAPVPKNLAEFEVSLLPRLNGNSDPGNSSKYNKLLEIHGNLPAYNHLLTGISKNISVHEIDEYVTQYAENRTATFKHFAVDQVEIVCPFPYHDLGKLTLVDMPGIGDVSLVDEEDRIKKLMNRADFLLFVRKPDPLGDVWEGIDMDLYNLCNDTITGLGIPGVDIKDNSFLVLNHVNISPTMNNYDNCKDMWAGATLNGMHFSDVAIIDCTDKMEISEKILGQVSTSFISKIGQLDSKIMSYSQNNILSIYNKTKLVIKHLEELEEPDDNMDLYAFKDLFNTLWNAQTNSFENLLKQKYSLRNERNSLIYTHFNDTRKHIKHLLSELTEADINLSRNSFGSYNKAYEDFLNVYKTHITNEFLKLDDILLEVLTNIKHEVYSILKSEGKLNYMEKSAASFESVLLEEVSNINELKNSLTSFINFQLSYLGFLHFRIREYLDILTPDHMEIRLSRDDSATDILKYIKHSVEACLYQIQKEFDIWSKDINKISFSLLEEFLNQIFRSKHAKDNWEIFYQLNRAKIWSERYENAEDRHNQYERLKLYVETTKKLTNEI